MTHRRLAVSVVVVVAALALSLAYALSQRPVDGPPRQSPAKPAAPAAGVRTAPDAPPVSGEPEGRWLPGDMHSHISPPDVPPNYSHAKNDLEEAIAAAKKAGLRWIVITPHAMDRTDEKTGRRWADEMADRLAQRQTAPDDPLVVLGWERTYVWPGDCTVSFVPLDEVFDKPVGQTLVEIDRLGGLAIAAHPFFLPNPIMRSDKSWKPWTSKNARGRDLDAWLSGLEIRHPMSPAVAGTRQWDAWIGRERRRVLGVGATDDHWGTLYPTTWVYVEGDLTRQELHKALAAGRIVVGDNPSAGTLTVASDLKAPGGRPTVGRIGDAIEADRRIVLRWEGEGRAFIDGRLLENGAGPVSWDFSSGTFHWIRLEVGDASWSNPVYVNLPAPQRRELPADAAQSPTQSRDLDAETHRPEFGRR